MVLINGQPSEQISVLDRGLCYGDGVFRTMQSRSGRAIQWERHFNKLRNDCRVLQIPAPERNRLETDLRTVCADAPDCVLKIIVTRGPGGRGYAIPDVVSPTTILITSLLPQYPEEYGNGGVAVRLCKTKLASQPALAGIKHLNRLENILARAEWSDSTIAEGLMEDNDGDLVEGTMTNLFIVKNNVLLTPDLSRCGVAGIQRDRVIEIAQQNNVKLTIGKLRVDDVIRADEAFLVNSIIGLWPIKDFQGKKWDSAQLPITQKVRRCLDDFND